MGTYIRFECGKDDVIGPTYGPYEWVQITYDTLRVSPEGDEIAAFNGDWFLNDREHDLAAQAWSDVIIYSGSK